MKRLIHGFVLCALLSMYACAGCPGENEECPHGSWSEEFCTCTCDDNQCVHGYWDEPNCNCDCYDNWSGYDCETFIPSNQFHADISYNDGVSNNFEYDVFELEFRNGMIDTLWLDAYKNGDDGQYVFLNLFLNDFAAVSSGSSFPINGFNSPGNCWSSVYLPSNNPEVFTPLSNAIGSITIDTLSVNYDGAGTNFVRANFEYSLYLLSGDSVHVVGYCDGAN